MTYSLPFRSRISKGAYPAGILGSTKFPVKLGAPDVPLMTSIAPASFGEFAGDLLVGNFGDGRINAFDLSNSTFMGQLLGRDGNPLTIDGLWGLTVGNGVGAGSSEKLYFSAGPNGEADGLFGAIQSAPEPTTMLLFGAGLLGLVGLRGRMKK